MTELGLTAGRPCRAVQGLLAALVGLALLLAAIVAGAVPAAAQNRVGASTPVMINTVGAATDISSRQRLGKTVLQPSFVVATGVAAEGAATSGLRDGAESCLNSFTADTPVLMADRKEEPIADVKVGDMVLATDPETGRTEARPVSALIRHSGKHTMVDLTLSDGSKLTTTAHHLFWDATTRTFTDAIDLHVGDQILSDHGTTRTISAEHAYERILTAFNLQIDGIHTYYAGTTPVLVHSSCISDADGLAHAAERHLPGGSLVTRDASLFDPGSNLSKLADATEGQVGRFNSVTGNVE